MLESLCEPGAHALMLYPTKALALDQREQLTRLTGAMAGPEIESWWYDGDTDREHRTVLRKTPPPILITNPDMLHKSFLGGLPLTYWPMLWAIASWSRLGLWRYAGSWSV